MMTTRSNMRGRTHCNIDSDLDPDESKDDLVTRKPNRVISALFSIVAIASVVSIRSYTSADPTESLDSFLRRANTSNPPHNASSRHPPPLADTPCAEDSLDEHGAAHIVPPPPGPAALVCCRTTAGPLAIAVHPAWAPRGAARFLRMVRGGFFAAPAPLFRAVAGFLVQFGLSGDPAVQARRNAK